MTFLLFKTLHVIAVIIFLGNIFTGLFWVAFANRTKNFETIAFAFEGVNQSDRYFTIPGVYAILIGGFGAAIVGGFKILSLGWILWSIVLFAVSGIIFMTRLVPLQREIVKFVRANSMSPESWEGYQTLLKSWEYWGYLALAAPFAAAVIMVLKPNLPGL